MKSGMLTKRTEAGPLVELDEVVLHCTKEEVRILFDALDLYCTAKPCSKQGKLMYHELGWNTRYFPDHPKPQNRKKS